MGMLEWAKNEVRLACEKENPEIKLDENGYPVEFDYGTACYESALKAFESLCNDGHSGMSIGFTKQILNRLIDAKPLTPIEGKEDEWMLVNGNTDNKKEYQCKRMSSLFKDIDKDGKVSYTDIDRFVCVDINNSSDRYYCGFIAKVAAEKFGPIAMPYMPKDKPIKIFAEDFLVNSGNGDFDTIGIFYAEYKEHGEVKRVEINRFFTDAYEFLHRNTYISKEDNNQWKEISKEEYEKLKGKAIK